VHSELRRRDLRYSQAVERLTRQGGPALLRLDQWVHDWMRRYAHGDVVVVRWADDFIMGLSQDRFGRLMR